MTLYKNKYRVETLRLTGWDYSSNGFYYITMCVHNREHVFGEIQDGTMILSDLGKIAKNCWRAIPDHFSFVKLDEFIVMPDHIHGIIKIQKPEPLSDFGGIPMGHIVETQDIASLRPIASNVSKSHFGPQSNNIASIIRGFKIGVTKYAKNNNIPFKWQSRFHDHIIRDYYDLNRTRKYIIDNPLNWKNEKNIK